MNEGIAPDATPLKRLWVRQWQQYLNSARDACETAAQVFTDDTRQSRTDQLGYAQPYRLVYGKYLEALSKLLGPAPRACIQAKRDQRFSTWNAKLQRLSQEDGATAGPVGLMLRQAADGSPEEKASIERVQATRAKLAKYAQKLSLQSDVRVFSSFVTHGSSEVGRSSEFNVGSLSDVLCDSERGSFLVAKVGSDPDGIANAVLAGRSMLILVAAGDMHRDREGDPSPVPEFFKVRVDPDEATILNDGSIRVEYTTTLSARSKKRFQPGHCKIVTQDAVDEIRTFLKSKNLQGLDPSILSTFMGLCREASEILSSASSGSDLAERRDESMTLGSARHQFDAVTEAYGAAAMEN
jgi:hypothetical protein